MHTELIPLTGFNWEQVASLELAENQKDFLPDNLFSIAQSKFDVKTIPFGIIYKEHVVGFAMYANRNGIFWITRIMVDKNYQQQGIGSTALRKLVEMIRRKSDCREVRTSVSRDNIWGQYLFAAGGFEPMGQDEKEVIMKYNH